MLQKFFITRIVYWFYRLLIFSWRTTIEEHPELTDAIQNNEPLIFAHWHGDELALIQTVREYHFATMTSTSKDGELVDYVIKSLGGNTSRGSSTRGGIGALKGLIRLIKGGWTASIAVDGPRGPIHQVKPGVFELSRLAKAAIVPVGAAAARPHTFQKSWNKAYLPMPFSKVGVYFGKPWKPLSKEDNPKSPELGRKLATEISDANQQALKIIANNGK